jgi:hypothetical protein
MSELTTLYTDILRNIVRDPWHYCYGPDYSDSDAKDQASTTYFAINNLMEKGLVTRDADSGTFNITPSGLSQLLGENIEIVNMNEWKAKWEELERLRIAYQELQVEEATLRASITSHFIMNRKIV